MSISFRAAAAALALGLLVPLAASAETTDGGSAVLSPVTLAASGPVHVKYATTLDASAYGGPAGAYEGVLDITLYPSGIIQGYYRPNDERFIPITGGFGKNNSVWFDLGSGGRPHVEGTFTGSGITGTTELLGDGYRLGFSHGSDVYAFSAIPIPTTAK